MNFKRYIRITTLRPHCYNPNYTAFYPIHSLPPAPNTTMATPAAAARKSSYPYRAPPTLTLGRTEAHDPIRLTNVGGPQLYR